ncbi:uncharacterized protein [Asterias amurensis]|uniref:uncharacterized protein n=1 Tax=Asterias amurensis TaxID=7602 RepID=UPI003AB60F06
MALIIRFLLIFLIVKSQVELQVEASSNQRTVSCDVDTNRKVDELRRIVENYLVILDDEVRNTQDQVKELKVLMTDDQEGVSPECTELEDTRRKVDELQVAVSTNQETVSSELEDAIIKMEELKVTVAANQEKASSEIQGIRRQLDDLQVSLSTLVEFIHGRHLELRECVLDFGLGTYQHGDTWDNNCSTCECVDGEVKCGPVACPALFCENPVTEPGQCCPKCGVLAGCFHRNTEHQSGETWADPIQSCISCTCSNGFVSCGPTDCSLVRCLDPIRGQGDCCGTCPDVSFGRTRLELYGVTNNYGLKLTVDIQNIERNIQGTEIWRVKLWSATRSNGGGAKTEIIKQALNSDQASQTIGVGDDKLSFENLEYVRDLGNLPCTSYPYVCAEFYMTRAGYDLYTTSTLFGDEISTICLEAC